MFIRILLPPSPAENVGSSRTTLSYTIETYAILKDLKNETL
jgi:hypothetical protein